MEKNGVVSLWIGKVINAEELDRLLTISYSDEGDYIRSIFAEYFKIIRYDDDLREAEYYENKVDNFYQLLEDFSYDYNVISEFKKVTEELPENINVAILLYDFEYNGKVVQATIQSNYLQFVGSIKYK
ncbi:immunity 22 family protein [Paenibacillus sp. PsM32]|uniref:immunity 22 family protein n=1 Tax=Paenibacillus sp. PsM32 TaxID=3030536 RepID=UPI00263B405F|nr:immunity 22 family protein [Paenibacillus sp. PsM32]MDN4621055.1 immunity 22 family protein [Paenibacillus sp. PsM32]